MYTNNHKRESKREKKKERGICFKLIVMGLSLAVFSVA